jgi:anaerobic selenocysteine-containing dehydrogenase
MDRRKFLNGVMGGMAGAAAGIGLAKVNFPLHEVTPKETKSVVYEVKGFSCITCATGLEVMLREQAGVVRASASYSDTRVMIGFDERVISEDKLKEFIVSCGFTVA